MGKKGKMRGLPRGEWGGGGTIGMLRQVQELQKKIAEAHAALGEETVTATAGGGAVTVVMTGHQQLRSVTISPEVLDAGDAEMLQDLVVAAVNEAVTKSRALAEERLSPLTDGIKIPGFM